MKCYPEIKEKEEMRKIIGRYGLTGKQQVSGGVEGWMWGTTPANWEIVAVRSGNAVPGVPGGLGAIPKVSSFFFFF